MRYLSDQSWRCVLRLLAGSGLLLVICVGVGLTANALRGNGISGFHEVTCDELLSKKPVRRYEIVYAQSQEFKTRDLNAYQFRDTRSITDYESEPYRRRGTHVTCRQGNRHNSRAL